MRIKFTLCVSMLARCQSQPALLPRPSTGRYLPNHSFPAHMRSTGTGKRWTRDTIKIRLSQDKTEQFKVQDGLIFDSVRYGDQVEVTVQNIAGAKAIVGLKE